MKRGYKIGLGALLIASLVAGYAVYWWHEISLDEAAVADNPTDEQVAAAAGVRDLIVSPDPRERARIPERLDRMLERDRERVLAILAEDGVTAVRLAAIPYVKRLKDRVPAARATLVRLALQDPEPSVKDAARDALGGAK
jgi:hypothetical protein